MADSNHKEQNELVSCINHKIEKSIERNSRYKTKKFNLFKLFILTEIDAHYNGEQNFEYHLFVSFNRENGRIMYEGKFLKMGSFLRNKVDMGDLLYQKFMYYWVIDALKDIRYFKVSKPLFGSDYRYEIKIKNI